MTDLRFTPRTVAIGLGAFAAGVVGLAAAAVALGRRVPADRDRGALGPHDAAPQPVVTDPILPGPPAHDGGAPTGLEGHTVPDLAADREIGPATRAEPAFRPDIDAPMTPAEREALRPATGPAPSLVSDRGGATQGPGGDLY